jgi:hypothetical protein
MLKQLGKTYSHVTITEKSFAAVSQAIKTGRVELTTRALSWAELSGFAVQMTKTSLKSTWMRSRIPSKRPTRVTSPLDE